ncbi:MAG: helix-turn-helix domain-containing protein [Gemmataceae bacterium]
MAEHVAEDVALRAILVTQRQVAQILTCSERTVYTMRENGEMPEPVPGRGLRWRLAEIEAWVEAGRPSLAEWKRMQASKGA